MSECGKKVISTVFFSPENGEERERKRETNPRSEKDKKLD